MSKADRPQWNAAKERFWRKLVSGFDPQQTTVRAWCVEHGVSEPSFYAWRRKLRRRDEKPTTRVQLLPIKIARQQPVVKQPTPKRIVIWMGSVQLRVTLEQLPAVLDVLEGRSC